MTWFAAPRRYLPDIIELNGRWRAEREAVVYRGERQSWRAFATSTRQIAHAFATRGLGPGDRVVFLVNNSLEMAQAIFGAIRGGLVAVPLNVSVSDHAVATLVADSGAKAMVASDQHVERVEAMRERLPPMLAANCIAHGAAAPDWIAFDAFRDAGNADFEPMPVTADDECNIIYSSGTTGLPKGIVHSHACRAAWAWDLAIALRYHSGARTLCSLGLYSNITWVAMLCTFVCGGTIVITPGFDPQKCLSLIERERITHTAMVPLQFQRLLDHPQFADCDLSSVHALMSCGSPLHEPLKKRIYKHFPRAFLELYGLTEGLITILSPEDAPTKLTSVGKPCPGQDLKILGAYDCELPAGEAGEIVGRGPLQMAGYLNRPDANQEATWTDSTGKRWLRTGDIGRLDGDGFLYLVDRKKDMIISGGQNIYPADIESVLAGHPAVAEVAVIGVPSERWGETPLAVAVLSPAATIAAEALRAWVNDRVGRQQRVAQIEYVDQLPRNPNGKVLKRELRQRFADLKL